MLTDKILMTEIISECEQLASVTPTSHRRSRGQGSSFFIHLEITTQLQVIRIRIFDGFLTLFQGNTEIILQITPSLLPYTSLTIDYSMTVLLFEAVQYKCR
jgi:hypothetical protein